MLIYLFLSWRRKHTPVKGQNFTMFGLAFCVSRSIFALLLILASLWEIFKLTKQALDPGVIFKF